MTTKDTAPAPSKHVEDNKLDKRIWWPPIFAFICSTVVLISGAFGLVESLGAFGAMAPSIVLSIGIIVFAVTFYIGKFIEKKANSKDTEGVWDAQQFQVGTPSTALWAILVLIVGGIGVTIGTVTSSFPFLDVFMAWLTNLSGVSWWLAVIALALIAGVIFGLTAQSDRIVTSLAIAAVTFVMFLVLGIFGLGALLLIAVVFPSTFGLLVTIAYDRMGLKRRLKLVLVILSILFAAILGPHMSATANAPPETPHNTTEPEVFTSSEDEIRAKCADKTKHATTGETYEQRHPDMCDRIEEKASPLDADS